jgi:hypothetical protein
LISIAHTPRSKEGIPPRRTTKSKRREFGGEKSEKANRRAERGTRLQEIATDGDTAIARTGKQQREQMNHLKSCWSPWRRALLLPPPRRRPPPPPSQQTRSRNRRKRRWHEGRNTGVSKNWTTGVSRGSGENGKLSSHAAHASRECEEALELRLSY